MLRVKVVGKGVHGKEKYKMRLGIFTGEADEVENDFNNFIEEWEKGEERVKVVVHKVAQSESIRKTEDGCIYCIVNLSVFYTIQNEEKINE